MKPVDYFATHPVFRFEEFVSAHQQGGARKPTASKAVLQQHLRAGHLVHLRRGLYAVVPRSTVARDLRVDPFLLASRLAPDAVIAFHAALRLHGRAHSLSRRVTCIVEVSRSGLPVRVTTLERTLVDVLDSPRHGGSWEEIWRSLESVEFFDVEAVTDYALKLGSAVTVAKVGFFLEQHREELMLEESHFKRLLAHAPAQPRYLERAKREPGKLVTRWNLVVPERVLNRDWAEVT